ncbi:MAG TPA: hypothetical protein VMH82_09060 [Myxococcota bacterium]|nr:hypothetical protein [Myxococcota bacterium]
MPLEVALGKRVLGTLAAQAGERRARVGLRVERLARLDGAQRAAELQREPRADLPARLGPRIARIEDRVRAVEVVGFPQDAPPGPEAGPRDSGAGELRNRVRAGTP